MKTSAIVAFLAAFASAEALRSGCASQCVNRLADGCESSDLACRCAKPGLIKQLAPCLESACADADALTEAKAAFTSECKAVGVKINFALEAQPHLDMVRRADASSADHAGMNMGGASATGAGGAAGAATATATAARQRASGSGARASGARATGTTKGAKPAAYTGAAVPREISGNILGFAAALAAVAAI